MRVCLVRASSGGGEGQEGRPGVTGGPASAEQNAQQGCAAAGQRADGRGGHPIGRGENGGRQSARVFRRQSRRIARGLGAMNARARGLICSRARAVVAGAGSDYARKSSLYPATASGIFRPA